MNIFIKSNFINKNYNYYFDASTNLYQILEYYLEKNKINLDITKIYFIYNAKILKKNTSLSDNNINNDSTIYINYNYNMTECSQCSLFSHSNEYSL